MKKTKVAFSLIEVLFAILLLSMIALFLMPALGLNLDKSSKIKDMADISFSLEEAVEISRKKEVGTHTENINGKDIEITIEKFQSPISTAIYKKITATYKGKSFELVEADD